MKDASQVDIAVRRKLILRSLEAAENVIEWTQNNLEEFFELFGDQESGEIVMHTLDDGPWPQYFTRTILLKYGLKADTIISRWEFSFEPSYDSLSCLSDVVNMTAKQTSKNQITGDLIFPSNVFFEGLKHVLAKKLRPADEMDLELETPFMRMIKATTGELKQNGH